MLLAQQTAVPVYLCFFFCCRPLFNLSSTRQYFSGGLKIVGTISDSYITGQWTLCCLKIFKFSFERSRGRKLLNFTSFSHIPIQLNKKRKWFKKLGLICFKIVF